MVELKSLTFDDQLAVLSERGLVGEAGQIRANLEAARPAESVELSVLTVSR